MHKLTIVGMAGNMALALFKLLAGIFGNSMAMVSDAVHSLSDVVATFVAFVGAKVARKSADSDHPYGHERTECVAAVVLSAILFVAAIGIGYAGILEIVEGSYEYLPHPTLLALVAAIVSIVVKEAMYHYTMHYARIIGSQAFEADAWHHRSDALSSIGALIGVGGSMLGYPVLDAVASVAICLVLLKVAFGIALDALNNVMDSSRGKEYEDEMRAFIASVPGVERVDLLHTRMFGSKTYVDLEISVKGEMKLVEAHEIAENVHHAIEAEYPDVKHVMVHVNPF